MRPRVLVFVDHYLPGYKAGGPLRTVSNLVERLGDEFSFGVCTADRDAREEVPYPGVRVDAWQRVGKADVFYASPSRSSLASVARLMRGTRHDVLYLNSFFSPRTAMMPLLARKLRLAPSAPLVIAPRGQFSREALALKRGRKRAYLAAARLLGLWRGAILQATNEDEARDIRRVLRVPEADLLVAPNLTGLAVPSAPVAPPAGGPLRVVFLSRIAPMKNLDLALRILGRVAVPVKLTIHGSVSDPAYWRDCRQLIEQLPKHVSVAYEGEVEHERVAEVVAPHDVFFLPTRGENHGHVILEALAAGVPALISDKTPWRDLEERGVGWSVPLDTPERFVAVLETLSREESTQRLRRRRLAARYAAEVSDDPARVGLNRQLLWSAVERGRAAGPRRASADSGRAAG